MSDFLLYVSKNDPREHVELEITGFSDVMPSKFELRGEKTSPSNKIDEYNYTQSCEQQQTDHKCLRMDFPLDSKPCSLSPAC